MDFRRTRRGKSKVFLPNKNAKEVGGDLIIGSTRRRRRIYIFPSSVVARQFQSVKSSIIIIGKGDYKYLPRIVMTFGNTRINLLLHDTFQLALEVFSSELLFFP